MASNYNFLSIKCDTFKICISNHPKKMIHHCHNEIEFMYFCHTGGCTYRINDREFEVQSGDLIIANPWEYHRCDDFGESPHVVCLIVNPGWLMLEETKNIIFLNQIANRPDIADLFRQMSDLLLQEPKAAISQAAYYRLVAKIGELTAILTEIGWRRRTGTREREIQRILEFIDKNLAEKLCIARLADQMYISTDRFYHVFKEVMGISPSEYIMEMRISKACLMLAESSHSITQIAQLCGFCTTSYFSLCFKKLLGVSPTQYRNGKGETNTDI